MTESEAIGSEGLRVEEVRGEGLRMRWTERGRVESGSQAAAVDARVGLWPIKWSGRAEGDRTWRGTPSEHQFCREERRGEESMRQPVLS